jgi:hypothetical protein
MIKFFVYEEEMELLHVSHFCQHGVKSHGQQMRELIEVLHWQLH